MKYLYLLPLLVTSIATAASHPHSHSSSEKESWGVGIGMRSANIIFDTSDNVVHDVMPLLFYQGESFYLDGASGGYRFYHGDSVSVGALGRIRFFDIPKRYQNDVQGTQFDLGGNITWHYSPQLDISAELLSDKDGRVYSNLTSEYTIDQPSWRISPYVTVTGKSSRFNNTYYALNTEDIGYGFSYSAGVKGRYQLYENLYAVGQTNATLLDNKTYQSDIVDSRAQWETYLGLALFNTPGQRTHSQLPTNSYLRIASGVATTSGVSDLLMLNNKTDPYRNTMTSVFYGHPVADTVFGWPLDFYVTPGFIQHHKSDVQGSFGEYVVAIKAYYTFNWPTTWRFGFAEGISYSTQISHIESARLSEKDYTPSKLMNYLDFSFDVNIGDVFNNQSLSNMWLGYSLHHRSGIFTQASAFGRIKGGSDYNSLYLQWDF